jgi:hypothetical protein
MNKQELSEVSIGNWENIARMVNTRRVDGSCGEGLDRCESVDTSEEGCLMEFSELVVREDKPVVVEPDFSTEVFLK